MYVQNCEFSYRVDALTNDALDKKLAGLSKDTEHMWGNPEVDLLTFNHLLKCMCSICVALGRDLEQGVN